MVILKLHSSPHNTALAFSTSCPCPSRSLGEVLGGQAAHPVQKSCRQGDPPAGIPRSASQSRGCGDEIATDFPQSAADIAAQHLSAAKDEGRNADDHQGVLSCAHASAVSQNMPK